MNLLSLDEPFQIIILMQIKLNNILLPELHKDTKGINIKVVNVTFITELISYLK